MRKATALLAFALAACGHGDALPHQPESALVALGVCERAAADRTAYVPPCRKAAAALHGTCRHYAATLSRGDPAAMNEWRACLSEAAATTGESHV